MKLHLVCISKNECDYIEATTANLKVEKIVNINWFYLI